ncbi:NAD(P)H-dependent flavin oxidoreductase [Streptomyces sp. NPDC050149]|uniref:NAD(P)H-dependent flavin oxidoreductase n=1 Tax=Streptomyces sp. NPDC050149 TaxID=3365603 RepID=UPI0037B524B9
MSGADPALRLPPPLAAGAAALGTELPLIQAGMGGVATPALAAAVSGAGALGTVALYKSDRALASGLVAATARATPAVFGVNVIPEVAGALLAEQLRAVLEAADRELVVNSYGLPPVPFAREVREGGHRLVVQAGTAEDADAAVAMGTRAVVLQGTDAGGHHLGTLPVRQLLARTAERRLGVPLFAAGGVHRGADLLGLAALGASGALCGTAFVATEESGAHPAYRQALTVAGPGDTVVTDRFSIGWPGRVHRVLRSPVTEAAEPLPAHLIAWTTVMGARRPVPRGSAAAPTREAEGRVDEMARYAGAGVGHVDAVLPAAAVVARLRDELGRAIRTDAEAVGGAR